MKYMKWLKERMGKSMDSSDLSSHDLVFHPGGYREGDRCRLRDAMRKQSSVDILVQNNEPPSMEVTPAMDAEYLESVENGDTRTALSMLRRLASTRMSRPYTNVHGEVTPMYTSAFDGNEVKGTLWLSSSMDVATGYSELKGLGKDSVRQFLVDLRGSDEHDAYGGGWDSFLDPDDKDAQGKLSRGEEVYPVDTDYLAERGKRLGYKSVMFKDVVDGSSAGMDESDTLAVFDGRKVKEYGVTSDDFGKPIPLSKRFDMESNDTRY